MRRARLLVPGKVPRIVPVVLDTSRGKKLARPPTCVLCGRKIRYENDVVRAGNGEPACGRCVLALDERRVRAR